MLLRNAPAWLYLVCVLAMPVLAGIAEYLKLAPPNTFYTVFVLAIGLIAPSPAFPVPAQQTATPQNRG